MCTTISHIELFFPFQIEDILRIHGGISDDHLQKEQIRILLSLDGVSESKSTSISLDVYSIKFEGCRDVFPFKIIRPLTKETIDLQEQFSLVLQSLASHNLIILALIGDNPKRAFFRNSLQHSARNACEYCFENGISFKETIETDYVKFVQNIQHQKRLITIQISELNEVEDSAQIKALQSIEKELDEAEKLGKKQRVSSRIVWPANTMYGEPRTKEKIIEIVEKIESGQNMTANEKKGIKGRSLLLNLDYFDYVLSIPTEYMHLLSFGFVKRLLELSFSVGESRSRNTKRALTSPDVFNELIKFTKVVHEFSRRVRKLDLAVMKAQELRNILIFFFPFITECLKGYDKEIKVWEMLAFIVRACILPEKEFESVNVNTIKYCQKQIYLLYQQLFGEKNCTYSIHVLLSHLLQMRSHGPLTETSAFVFESFYGELRNSFQVGTQSVIKQMMQTVVLKRLLSKHVCSESIYLKVKDTAMECNSLIYVYELNQHVIYKINSIEDNYQLICNQLGNHEVIFENTPMLNWSSVGVYRKGGLSSIDVIVPRNKVDGKVIKVGKYLVTCPVNILREK